jgi:uncharacterized protein (DUF58 family)
MKWFLGVLLILLAALLLESGLLAYAAYVLIGLLLVSRVLARNWVGQLTVARLCRLVGRDGDESIPDGLTAEIGDRVAVRLVVRNNGAMPVPWVLLEDMLPRHALDQRFPRLKVVKGKRLQIGMLRGGSETTVRYQIECLQRGYYQIGPLVMENGDLFGLHRRFRVDPSRRFLLVYPKTVPLLGYDLTSRRPIGDVRLSHRLYEDPTRIAGVRPYEAGDPLNRVHWRATARTGALHSKVYEPSCLAGATLVLDFHAAGFPPRGEPFRSELAVTAAASLANAVCEMGQQVGLVTNARDASTRLRGYDFAHEPGSRAEAQAAAAMAEEGDSVRPMVVETKRGVEQLRRIRETLALAEPTDALTLAGMLRDTAGRLPRDATVIAMLPAVSVASAVALGSLRRLGLAVTVVLVMLSDEALETAYKRLMSANLRDIRHLKDEASLPDLCRLSVDRSAPYHFV